MPDSPCPIDMPPAPRRGVVAVIWRQGQFLVIRRSQFVRAPRKFCFPGGGIEPGESEPTALLRELREELGVRVRPLRRIWSSTSPSGVQLAWWHAQLPDDQQLVPFAPEVESVHWMSPEQLRQLPELLSTNRQFLQALEQGKFHLGSPS